MITIKINCHQTLSYRASYYIHHYEVDKMHTKYSRPLLVYSYKLLRNIL